jgi:hypothetical protein
MQKRFRVYNPTTGQDFGEWAADTADQAVISCGRHFDEFLATNNFSHLRAVPADQQGRMFLGRDHAGNKVCFIVADTVDRAIIITAEQLGIEPADVQDTIDFEEITQDQMFADEDIYQAIMGIIAQYHAVAGDMQ